MTTPRVRHDPEGDKRRALDLAAHAASRYTESESKRSATMRFASDCGASLREIAEATGVPHMTVKRLIERTRA